MMLNLLYGFISLSCLYCLDVNACGVHRVWPEEVRQSFLGTAENSTIAVKKSNESFEQMKRNVTKESIKQALSDVELAIDKLEKCKKQLEENSADPLLKEKQLCIISRRLRLIKDRKFYLTSETGVEDAAKRGYYDHSTAGALISVLQQGE